MKLLERLTRVIENNINKKNLNKSFFKYIIFNWKNAKDTKKINMLQLNTK